MPDRKKGHPYFVQTLELNEVTYRNVFFAILDLSPVFDTGSFYIPVIVGASILQNSVVHIDFKNMNLIIEK